MLDLKAKLLAAGVVTVDQVKKVEDEQAARQARDAERRDAERRRREEGPPQRSDRGGDRGPRPDRGDGGHRGDRPQRPRGDGPPPRDGAPRGDRPRGDGPRGDQRGPGGDRPQQPRGDRPQGDRPRGDRPPREPRPVPATADGVVADGVVVEGAGDAPKRAGKPRDTRSFKERRVEENLEKRARREHEWNEAMRWRGRIDALKAAGKSEQYEATRGWVMKERLDNKQITEAAQRFFFTTYAGTLSHLTVEPEIHAWLVDGSAGIVAFVGYNGQEHAVVPKDIAVDVRAIKPEWLRHLIGITDLEPPLVKPPVVETPEGAAEGTVEAAADGADAAVIVDGGASDDGEGQAEAVSDVASTEPEAG